MAEVATAVTHIGLETGAITNEKIREVNDIFYMTMGVIGIKNLGKGVAHFAKNLPNNVKTLIRENKSIRELITAKYLDWQIAITNIDRININEIDLLAEQEKVWQMLQVTNKTDDYIHFITSVRQRAILNFGKEAEDLIYVKFNADGGAAAEIIAHFGQDGINALKKVNNIQDAASELIKGKTAYRHIGTSASYLNEIKRTGIIPKRTGNDLTYFSLDKIDDPMSAIDKMQLNSSSTDAVWRAEFDASQLMNKVEIPKGKWNNTEYLEVLTRSYPEYGSGGASQFITQSEINIKRFVNLKTGEVINFK
jgi:hypothetical protein